MSDAKTDDAKPKKKGGLIKLLLIGGGALLLTGGGAAAGLYLSGSGLMGGGSEAHAEDDKPKLVPKSEEKRASLSGEKDGEGGGDHGGGDHGGGEAGSKHKGKPTPEGEGGDRYASNYYAMEKEFTSNLRESVHFVQVGIAISTPYDDRVLENLKTHEIAVRSAVLMALGETDEDQVFTLEGKQQLQKRLAKAINGVLEEKEGFGGIGNVYFTNFVVQ